MTILILEDEIPAYQKLTTCLERFFDIKISHDWGRSIADGEKFLKEKSFSRKYFSYHRFKIF